MTSLAALPRWVGWKEERRDGQPDRKPAKVPYNPVTRKAAKPDDPTTWATRAKADAWAKRTVKGGRGGVGIMLGQLPGGTVLAGLDLDSCFSASGEPERWAAEIIKRFASYTEVSPSGKGVKIFFLIDRKDAATVRQEVGQRHRVSWTKDETEHLEIALDLSHRYYTVTWYELGRTPEYTEAVGPNDRLRVVQVADLRWLIHEAGPRFKGGTKSRDETGSGALFRLAIKIKAQGGNKADFEAAIADDPEAAAHVDKEGQRAIDRAWENAPDPRDQADMFADIEEVVGGYVPDEEGVIRAFTDKHAHELKFDHHAGRWFRFTGSHWQREETKLAQHYAREVSIELARRNPNAKPLRKVSVWEAVERASRAVREFAVKSDVWNVDKMLLGTPGGTVDLRTGELRKARPFDHISHVTAVAPIPLDQFNPQTDCPQWLAFLDEALAGDRDAIRFLQQWGGYSLTGETKEQKLVFVYGPGGSGKGTAINTIADIMGNYAANVGMETLTASKYERHTTELARLQGARMARASETEKGRAWAENRIKNLTGQDTITARFMRQDDFEFRPEFKLTIFGNNRPSLRDVDEAIKRRFLILPFDHQPARRDPELPENLKAEWSGILSWLIAGCLDWQANGLVIPRVMDTATRAYFDAEDTFAQWLADCCEVGPEFADTSDNLWDSWSRYAYKLGEDPGTMKGSFAETLSQRGFRPAEKVGPSRKRGYKGLHLRDDTGADDESFR
ncbi:phage/plasmid primase, P4 family [Neorhizobium petrolearium]|uniref:phage/plasmid primase, P4 family n=1 Tax=Neorhizobium petrolearium TaxID=515361 RepID=UPI003F155B52